MCLTTQNMGIDNVQITYIKYVVKKVIPGSSILDTRKKGMICVFNFSACTKGTIYDIIMLVWYEIWEKIFWKVIIVCLIIMRYYFLWKCLNESTSLISCGRVFHSLITVGTIVSDTLVKNSFENFSLYNFRNYNVCRGKCPLCRRV